MLTIVLVIAWFTPRFVEVVLLLPPLVIDYLSRNNKQPEFYRFGGYAPEAFPKEDLEESTIYVDNSVVTIHQGSDVLHALV